jgi:hypothetical protein
LLGGPNPRQELFLLWVYCTVTLGIGPHMMHVRASHRRNGRPSFFLNCSEHSLSTDARAS